MTDYRDAIRQYLRTETAILNALDPDAISAVLNRLERAREEGACIYLCGNGGSAATASHFVCDFNKGVSLEQEKKYRFCCLSDNLPLLTAVANDIGYEHIFEIPLQGRMEARDLLIAISGSGNSANVLRAAAYAKQIGAEVIGLTGYSGGRLREMADYSLHVPVDDMQITEDVHMMLDHLMMKLLTKPRDIAP